MRWIRPVICVLGLSTLVADGGLTQDQLDCEEAVSYLQGCCPDFQAPGAFACDSEQGCDTSISPALTIGDSQCIVARSCSDLVSQGVCSRAQDVLSPTTAQSPGPHSSVCP